MIHLTLAGREPRSIALDPAQIESISDLRFDDTYERDGRSRVRTKSGAECLVREDRVQIESQMGGAL